ncbi:MAG: hypothetical protein HLUCCX14_17730 [Marinobacter excellens HL-55]|uniref:Uncharacterized protein n=1 Tax=Marinobacter excellens HL-55 TaxID=1305731 RepID=A0A0N8KJX9_9GAMM|nr:MAG: hypothetical protein HLUCCX14_17730 [Marinobacter excellens HL-55]
MKPLIRKSWYTLPEAADYLTEGTKGRRPVSVANLLQMAEEGTVTLTLQAFANTPGETGELVAHFNDTLSNTAPELAPAGARVEFYDDEKYRGRKLRMSPLNDNGPPFLFWHPCERVIIESGQLRLPYMFTNRALFRFWWRLSLKGETFNPAQLIAASKADEPHLLGRWLYLSEPTEEPQWFVRIPLAALHDDALIGITTEQLEALLPGNTAEHAGEPTPAFPDNTPEDVRLLLQAWRLFWTNATPRDRSTRPDRGQVVAWLESKKMSGKLADAGATMITPEWARKGGRK